MSSFVWVVKGWTCARLEDINQAIRDKDPNWEGLHGADQIISIQWVPSEQRYYVTWRARKWQEDSIWEEDET